MKNYPSRRSFLALALALLLGLGGIGIWKISRNGNRQSFGAATATDQPVVGAVIPGAGGTRSLNGAWTEVESREVQNVRAELDAASNALALAQMSALEGVAEAEQPAALTRFAETHQQAMAEVSAMELQLRDPKFNPSIESALAEAAAAQIRFAAVRRLITEEGLTTEEAEARAEAEVSR